MRRWLYLITEDRNERIVGNIEEREVRYPGAQKNTETYIQMRNLDEGDNDFGETWDRMVVSLGYEDFDDEADKDDRMLGEMRSRVLDIDEQYREKAGISPSEWEDVS